MKANEAPEKIYLQENTTTDCYEEFWPEWFEAKAKETDIEYTRTDAFIEKACDAYCKVCGHYVHTTPTYICRQACDYYKDFRTYMKEE